MRRVCLIGAGKAARMHAQALSNLPGTEIVAVCDTDATRARSFAEQHGVRYVFGSAKEAIANGTFDFAHVLVPPDRHSEVAVEIVDAGIGVLLEKPMARSRAECDAVISTADERGVRLGVNHNSLFYPPYRKLRQALLDRRLGALEHLIVTVNRPRQWLTQNPSWFYGRPEYLAYESAIHPLAQIFDLAGTATSVATLASGRHELRGGLEFYERWQASLACERGTAQLLLSYGEYPIYQLLAICHDGLITTDVEAGRFTAIDRTRFGRTRFDRLLKPMRTARKASGQELAHGLQNLLRELRALGSASAPANLYEVSIQHSIAAFHRGPSAEEPNVDGRFGAQVVTMCDELTRSIAAERPRRVARSKRIRNPDVVVLGGTGCIGTALLEQMASAGMTARVVARSLDGLPPLFDGPNIELQQGDVRDPGSVSDAVRGARAVVHLANGRGPSSFGDAESAFVQPARLIAQACLQQNVQRIVCTSSIAPLYLGDPHATITAGTPVDPQVRRLGPDAWGKAQLERTLFALAHAESLSLSILRPGIVLGRGATVFHQGFGEWRSEVHCVGWNAGTNPLPLVLVSDVAAAIVLALGRKEPAPQVHNLVGHVRLSARECVAELGAALERPLRFHPAHPVQHRALALCEASVGALLRRNEPPPPTLRILKSRGCVATFDCSDTKRELGWEPVADRAEFVERAFHGLRS